MVFVENFAFFIQFKDIKGVSLFCNKAPPKEQWKREIDSRGQWERHKINLIYREFVRRSGIRSSVRSHSNRARLKNAVPQPRSSSLFAVNGYKTVLISSRQKPTTPLDPCLLVTSVNVCTYRMATPTICLGIGTHPSGCFGLSRGFSMIITNWTMKDSQPKRIIKSQQCFSVS